MSLIFNGNTNFQLNGPAQYQRSQTDLDRLLLKARGGANQLTAYLATLDAAIGGAASFDSGMFFTNYSVDEHKQFPTVTLQYEGRKGGVLPPPIHERDDSVMSASSRKLASGLNLTNPATVQYYGPTSILTYLSFGAMGTDVAPDPIGDPRIITLTSDDVTFAWSGTVQDVVNQLFSLQLITTFQATELVPGKWFKNISRKAKIYSPRIFSFPSGAQLSLYNPGSGYRVGDALTVSFAGQVARLTVTQVMVLWGDPDQAGVYSWNVTSNSFTAAHNAVPATGGSGSGAAFNVFGV